MSDIKQLLEKFSFKGKASNQVSNRCLGSKFCSHCNKTENFQMMMLSGLNHNILTIFEVVDELAPQIKTFLV